MKTRYFKMKEKTGGEADAISHWVTCDGKNLFIIWNDGIAGPSGCTIKELEEDSGVVEVSKEDLEQRR